MTEIRPVTRRDRYRVVAMMQRSWIDAYPPMVPARRMRRDKARGIDRWFGTRMAWPGYQALMAGPPSAPLGVCAFYPVHPGLFEIDLMFVASNARSKGVGTALLEEAISAIERHHSVARLWVGVKNVRAQRWYARLRFGRTGRRTHLAWNGFAWQVEEMRRCDRRNLAG